MLELVFNSKYFFCFKAKRVSHVILLIPMFSINPLYFRERDLGLQ